MDLNPINNLHTPTKLPIYNNSSSTSNWEKEGFSITMDMEDHRHQHQHKHQHHHQHQHQQQYQHENYNHHHLAHHPHISLHDPLWHTYHNLPTSPPPPPISSSPSSITIKPFSLLQDQVIEENDDELGEEEEEELGAMKEMMYRIAVMQPVDIDPASINKPKRRNVRISNDPQSVAARHRRERISERIRILQRLVPGGTKMDTASMLDEAIRYVKFLKRQIRQLQQQPGSSNHHPPLVPALPPSDWQPLGSLVGPSSSSGNSKAVLIRDKNSNINNHHHHNEEMMVFQHGDETSSGFVKLHLNIFSKMKKNKMKNASRFKMNPAR